MAAHTLEFGPPLPCSRLRRFVYRFANADPADIACHADRSRWTRIATCLALYFLYASLGTFTFLRGILSGSQLDCALGAVVVAGSVISFDRGILGTTNANMELVEVQGEDAKVAANLVRAHADPVLPTKKALLVGRVVLAILMASLVTEQLNAAAFHPQIQHQEHNEHLRDVKALFASPEGPEALGQAEVRNLERDLTSARANVEELKAAVARSNRGAIASSRGQDASGKPGCGPECHFFLRARDRSQAQLEGAEHSFALEVRKDENAIAAVRSRTAVAERNAEKSIEGDHGGLSDTLALYSYLGAHPEGLLLFGPMSLLLFALDLGALLYKVGAKDSLYERRQALRIRLGWQADVAATQLANRAFISALDTTIDAYETARRGLKDRISKGLRDPEVSKRLGLIARDALLSQLDRRRADRGAPRGGDRRKQDHESVVRPAPPLQRFPQRAGREGQFELIELVPGATVTGERHWRLVSRLPAGRQGGHSVVFEAVEVGGTERVVIKFMYLPRAQATDIGDIVRERARRELRNVGKLPSSPFIVPIVDTVIEPAEGAIWLATRLAELGSLASFYRSRPSRSVREVVVVAGQVAAALNVAYTERRLVHRDVKPGNVLVFRIEQRDGHGPAFPVPRVQVTDWGLSRIESLMESALDLSPGGTLWFAAPQAHHAGPADPRDDLFGLGCLIWWLVVGEPPLFAELGPEAGSGEIAALVRHRQETPEPWHDLGFWQPNTPPDLAALVRELMSYDRELRAPAGANPLHWAETQLKLMLDLLDLEAHRTGTEPTVGPAWEAEGVRSALTGNAASLPDEDPFSRADVDATATDDDASRDAGRAAESGDPVPAGGRDSNFPTDDDSAAEAR